MYSVWEKLYPSNKNYGSTITIIANLIFAANTPTPDLKIYHLGWNLTASCLCCWSSDLTKRKLPMQCTVRMEVYAKEVRKAKSTCYWTYIQISGIQVLKKLPVSLNSCDLFFNVLAGLHKLHAPIPPCM